MNRRIFVKNSLIALAGIAAGQSTLMAAPDKIKLLILHTNDVHSRIEPFPLGSGRNAGKGGVARRKTVIDNYRKKYDNVLLLDAGDAFQGTPYFNYFGGELEYKLMSKLGYDATTLGNHDFDNGIAGLERNLPHTNFPILISNYDFRNNSLKDRFKPYTIFVKEGIRIGVFGLGIDFKGLVSEELHGKTIYNDPIASAREMVQELNRQKCDLIICLSHLGYKYNNNAPSDIVLAQKVSGIDLIIGGHTHTFLDHPIVIKNDEGFQTLVNQVGFAGINLGKIEFTFDRKKLTKDVTGSASIPIDSRYDRI
jgi:5'-nucleotidase